MKYLKKSFARYLQYGKEETQYVDREVMLVWR